MTVHATTETSVPVPRPSPTLHYNTNGLDVLLDMRGDGWDPITDSTEPRHTITTDNVTVSASFQPTPDKGDYLFLQWTDKFGFTAAIATPTYTINDDPFMYRQLKAFFPSIAHLFTSPRVTIRKYEQQNTFVANVHHLSALLQDPDRLFAPIAGVHPHDDHVGYRLGWGAFGYDVENLPALLRDPAIIETCVPEWGKMPPPRVLPYGLNYRYPDRLKWSGLKLASTWTGTKFPLDEIESWAAVVMTYAPVYHQEPLTNGACVKSVREFFDLGFTPRDVAVWVTASAPNPGGYPRLNAETLRECRRVGVTPVGLYQVVSQVVGNPIAPWDLQEHVTTWLSSAPATKVGWYAAAGMSPSEAHDLEDSSSPPTAEALEVLAALRLAS